MKIHEDKKVVDFKKPIAGMVMMSSPMTLILVASESSVKVRARAHARATARAPASPFSALAPPSAFSRPPKRPGF